MESKLFTWTTVYSKIELDSIDASMSLDQLDDSTFLYVRNYIFN